MITKNVNVVSTMDLFLLVDSHNRSLAIGVPPLRFSTSEGLNCTFTIANPTSALRAFKSSGNVESEGVSMGGKHLPTWLADGRPTGSVTPGFSIARGLGATAEDRKEFVNTVLGKTGV